MSRLFQYGEISPFSKILRLRHACLLISQIHVPEIENVPVFVPEIETYFEA